MAVKNTVGLTLEGFGDGALHLTGLDLRLSTVLKTVSGVAYYVPQLAEWPRAIRTELEPLDGHVTQASMTFTITGLDQSDAANTNYGNSLLRFFWATRRRKIATLSADVNATTTSWAVTLAPGATSPTAGDIIYCSREVVYVSNVSGSAPSLTLTVTRGVLGSVAEAHDGRDPFVYDVNPVAIDRPVTLYELDLTDDSETTRFNGITENYRLTRNLMGLELTCRDLLGRITDRNLGNERLDGVIRMTPLPGDVDSTTLHSQGVIHTKIYPGGTPLLSFGDTADYPGGAIAIEVDGHAFTVGAFALPAATHQGWGHPYYLTASLARSVDGQTLGPDGKGEEYPFREILIGDADNDHCFFKDDSSLPTDHPADIIRCILASTGTATWASGGSHTLGDNGDYDWLPKHWGLAIDDALIDHTSFNRVRSRWPTRGLRYRNFYLGGGDDDIPAGDVLFDLAQACNCYLYLTPTGKIAMRHFGDPGLALVDATLTAGDVAWLQGADANIESAPQSLETVYAMKLELGQRGPGGDPADSLKGVDFNFYEVNRYRYLAKEDVVESTRVYGDPVTHQVNELRLRIAAVFATRFLYQNRTLPTYDLTLHSHAPRVTAGQWIALSHPALIDVDYTRGISAHRCLILSADWAPETGRQRIRVVDWAPAVQSDTTISPAWVVTSVTSGTVFNVDTNYFTDATDTSFWQNASEGIYTIELWTKDGQRRSENFPEGTISGSQVTLSLQWQEPGKVNITPNVGDVVRITEYFAGTANWYTTQGYTAIGDANALIGSVNDAAARWSY